jgi:hypothetical protein
MKLVMTLEAGNASPDELQTQIDYHRAAGVDEVVTAPGVVVDADWVIAARAGEFWWPRGESLKDVLAPIPPRYTIVQGLVRELAPPELTRRSTVEELRAAGRTLLRPVRRRGVDVREVPLRAWYPLEVFSVRAGDVVASASVEDTRLRDALQRLRSGGPISFPTPDIVDDAAYAVECAAVGEVDLPRLEAYVAELEQRVAFLEQRLWPRVLRAASGVARRGRGVSRTKE